MVLFSLNYSSQNPIAGWGILGIVVQKKKGTISKFWSESIMSRTILVQSLDSWGYFHVGQRCYSYSLASLCHIWTTTALSQHPHVQQMRSLLGGWRGDDDDDDMYIWKCIAQKENIVAVRSMDFP